MAIDIMIDIETLDSIPTANCIQLAAVAFSIKDGRVFDQFEACLNIQQNNDAGLTTSKATLNWWSHQNQDVFNDIMQRGSTADNHTVWENFEQWLAQFSNKRYWCHATFDVPIINYNLYRYGRKQLNYKAVKDIRTLTELAETTGKFRLDDFNWDKNKTHNALDDCKFQIEYCCAAWHAILMPHHLNKFNEEVLNKDV